MKEKIFLILLAAVVCAALALPQARAGESCTLEPPAGGYKANVTLPDGWHFYSPMMTHFIKFSYGDSKDIIGAVGFVPAVKSSPNARKNIEKDRNMRQNVGGSTVSDISDTYLGNLPAVSFFVFTRPSTVDEPVYKIITIKADAGDQIIEISLFFPKDQAGIYEKEFDSIVRNMQISK